jgi:hypothetical protein
MNNEKIHNLKFFSVYPHYIAKAERKGRTKEEVHQIIYWLTGFDEAGLQSQIDKQSTFKTFFEEAPQLHPNVHLIKGVICGYRVEDIEDRIVQLTRYLDKLIDELAKGKKMEKILRS